MTKLGDQIGGQVEQMIERMREAQARLLVKRERKRKREKRRVVEARPPRESKKAKAFRRWRDQRMGKLGAASKVRHVEAK